MKTLEKIERDILTLSDSSFAEFRNWFYHLDQQRWDRSIEQDSASGKLDFLVEEASEASRTGSLKAL